MGAVQSRLVVGQRGLDFIQIMLGLLNLFRPRTVFEFIQIGLGSLGGALRLVVLGAELIIF